MRKDQKGKTARSVADFCTLDGFLKDQDKLAEFQAMAIEEVQAWQVTEAIKTNK